MSCELPEGWSDARLGEIANISMGETILSKDLTGRGVPVFSANTDKGPWGYTNRNRKTLKRGTIVVGARGSIGFPRLPEFDEFICTQTTISVEPKRNVDSGFLFSALQNSDIKGMGAQQAIPMLTIGALSTLPVALPALDEQRRIAAVIRSVDETIVAGENSNDGISTLLQFVTSNSFPEPNDEKSVGEIVSFGDLFDIKGGSQPPKSTFIYEPRPGYIRLLQIRDFETDDRAAYVNVKSTSVRCEADDVFIARYGASVGRILTGKSGAYNVALAKLVFRNDSITRRYAYHFLRSEYFQSRIRSVSGRSAQAGFNKEDLFPTRICLPPLAEQRKIAEMLDALEISEVVGRSQLTVMRALKAQLASDLLSGRVRVPA